MKRKGYNFKWFKKEESRCCMRASVSKDGKLRLGSRLMEKLPEDILVGFDAETMVLAVADGHGSGTSCPASGVLPARELAEDIRATGLRLPVSFRVVWDRGTHFFLGRVIPRRQGEKGKRSYDMEQLLVLHKPIIDRAVQQMAKSMPLAERRDAAREALFMAAQSYWPGCGEMEDYLEEQVRERLLQENKSYIPLYHQRSLDRPLVDEEGNHFCLYDTDLNQGPGELEAVTDRVAREQFLATLSKRERTLVQMLESDIPSDRIREILDLDEETYQQILTSIEKKGQAFFSKEE